MQLPNEPVAGQPIPASWGAMIVRYLRSITPRPSPDILPSVGAGGTTFKSLAKPGIAGGSNLFPFQLVDVSETVDGTWIPKLRVVRSNVSGIVPPGFSDGDTPLYIVNGLSESGKAFIVVRVDEGSKGASSAHGGGGSKGTGAASGGSGGGSLNTGSLSTGSLSTGSLTTGSLDTGSLSIGSIQGSGGLGDSSAYSSSIQDDWGW